jgi:hypothetical protein
MIPYEEWTLINNWEMKVFIDGHMVGKFNRENYDFLKRLELEEIPGPINDRDHYFIVKDTFGHIDQVIGTDLVDRGKEFLKKCPIQVIESPFLTQEEISQRTETSTDMLRQKLESMKGKE